MCSIADEYCSSPKSISTILRRRSSRSGLLRSAVSIHAMPARYNASGIVEHPGVARASCPGRPPSPPARPSPPCPRAGASGTSRRPPTALRHCSSFSSGDRRAARSGPFRSGRRQEKTPSAAASGRRAENKRPPPRPARRPPAPPASERSAEESRSSSIHPKTMTRHPSERASDRTLFRDRPERIAPHRCRSPPPASIPKGTNHYYVTAGPLCQDAADSSRDEFNPLVCRRSRKNRPQMQTEHRPTRSTATARRTLHLSQPEYGDSPHPSLS